MSNVTVTNAHRTRAREYLANTRYVENTRDVIVLAGMFADIEHEATVNGQKAGQAAENMATLEAVEKLKLEISLLQKKYDDFLQGAIESEKKKNEDLRSMYKCVKFVSRNMNPLTTTVASIRAMNKAVDIVLKKFSHYQEESETLTTSTKETTEQVAVYDDARFSVKSTVQNMGSPPDQKDLKSALTAISNRMYTPEGVYLSENQARALISYVASGWECVGCGPTIGTNQRDPDGTIWPCSGGGCANFEPVFCLQLDPAPVQSEAGTPPKFKAIVDHSTHGRGDLLSGPDDVDCDCRNTSEEKACALSGCGFCSAARTREKLFVRPTAEQASAAADFIEFLVQKGLFGFVNGVFQGTIPLSRFIARREQELQQRSVAIGIFQGKAERDALCEERDAARRQIADYKDDFLAVVAGDCAPDEKHCSCVPHLRARIAELEQESADRLRAAAKIQEEADLTQQALKDVQSRLAAAEKERQEAARCALSMDKQADACASKANDAEDRAAEYLKQVIALEQENARLRAPPPKHTWWQANDPDCPRDIKTWKGELHTLRCKTCGSETNKISCAVAGSWASALGVNVAEEMKEMQREKAEEKKTICAACTKMKPCPLRRDEMGGYVCLTCIDKELDANIQTQSTLSKTINQGKEREAIHIGYVRTLRVLLTEARRDVARQRRRVNTLRDDIDKALASVEHYGKQEPICGQ